MTFQDKKIDLSIVLPCLNEEKAILFCLDSIQQVIQKNHLNAEVIIVDNNSTDASTTIVHEYQKSYPQFPLTLVEEKIAGYGSAYQKGFLVVRGLYVFMADLDGTYDFADIPRFVEKLHEGHDLVVGNRFVATNSASGKKTLGSMPWHHRYIGNPFLSAMVRLFFGIKIHDIHCGARAIKLESYKKLNLNTGGMEYASEMIIKASKEHLSIAEIPVAYSDRIGISKLNSFRDGWRHMRFIFLYSPLVIFLIPGLLLLVLGFFSMIVLYASTPSFLNITFYVHPMFLSAGCIISGYQLVYFALFAKTYALVHLNEKNTRFEKLFKHITLERACIVGVLMLVLGALIYSIILYGWVHSGFGALDAIKNSIVSLTLLVIGVQTISSAFMLSIIGIKK